MSMAGLIGVGIIQALVLLMAAPLYSGFSRVLRAKIHTRKGPPLMQNYRDIAKLMKRQEVVSEQAGWVFHAAPYVSMAAMLLAALIIPVLAAASPFGIVGDLILVVYLFALPRVFFSLAGLESGSTFGGIGARRELLVAALVEPVLILVVFVMALLAGSTNLGTISYKVSGGSLPHSMAFWLGMAAFAFAVFIEMGKLPFDLGEAEQELQEGPLSEYSGRSLALVKWSLYLKQIVLVALFLALFFPVGSMTRLSLPGLFIGMVVFLLKVLVFYFGAALLENAMARMRFMKAPAAIWLALGAAVLSFVFYLADV
jgi:hydrogenase-4 component C